MAARHPEQILPIYPFSEQGLDLGGPFGLSTTPGTAEKQLDFGTFGHARNCRSLPTIQPLSAHLRGHSRTSAAGIAYRASVGQLEGRINDRVRENLRHQHDQEFHRAAVASLLLIAPTQTYG